MTKDELRREIRQRFLCSSEAERCRWAEEVCCDLRQDEKIEAARYIFAFYPMKDEVDILPFLAEAKKEGKVVLLPEVVDAENMILREYTSTAALCRGMYGTMRCVGVLFTRYDLIDVALVPGLAFTKGGVRLGRGKGFYDHFLPQLTNAYKRGVCFPFQVVDDIPCEAHDVRMDYV